MKSRISVVEKLGYGSGDLAANFLFHTWNLFLLKFYVDVFGISASAAATMFMVTRILDIVTDPMVGILADRTNTRWGRYRPWVLIGSIPLGITGYLMFITPEAGYDGKLLYAWISYSVAMLCYTIVQIPYSALMGVMTADPKERTTLSSFRFFMAFSAQFVVGVVTLSFIEFFGGGAGEEINEAKGYAATIALYMVIATALYFFTFFSTRERIKPPANAGNSDVLGDIKALATNAGWAILFASAVFNLMHVAVRNGSLLFYFDYYVGDQSKASFFFGMGTAFFLAGILCANIWIKYFSKRVIMIFMTCGVALTLAMFYFIPADRYDLMVVVHCISNFMGGPMPVLLYVMYAEVADYTEWKSGRKVMALVYSSMLIAVKFGLVIGGALAGYLLGLSGYVPNEQQSAAALNAIVLLISVIPAVFALISGLLLIFYPLKEHLMEKVEKQLAEKRKQEGDEPDPKNPPEPVGV